MYTGSNLTTSKIVKGLTDIGSSLYWPISQNMTLLNFGYESYSVQLQCILNNSKLVKLARNQAHAMLNTLQNKGFQCSIRREARYQISGRPNTINALFEQR